MGTYYSQLAGGFLFPNSQPAPASKSWEPDQNCLQMLCLVAKLCYCSGMALGFQLHNEVAVAQNCPSMKSQVHWDKLSIWGKHQTSTSNMK